MSYVTQFETEVERKVSPLAKQAAAIARQIDTLRKRTAIESERLVDGRAHLADLRAKTGVRVVESTEGFERFKATIRRRTQEVQAVEEALEVLHGLIEVSLQEREAATRELHKAMVLVSSAIKRDCENVMRSHIASDIDERAAFLRAAEQAFLGVGLAWTGESFDHESIYPDVCVLRPSRDAAFWVAHELSERTLDRNDVPPHVRAAIVAALATPTPVKAAPDAAPTPQDAPGATPTPAVDAPDGPKHAPDGPQNAQEHQKDATGGPLASADDATRLEPRAGEPTPEIGSTDALPPIPADAPDVEGVPPSRPFLEEDAEKENPESPPELS